MIEPNGLDPMGVAALVARTIDEIDQASEEERDMLLRDLLLASWGSLLAQSQ